MLEEIEEDPHNHFLERPEFGPMPERVYRGGTRGKPSTRWDGLLSTIREHPGQTAVVAKYDGKSKKWRAQTDHMRLRAHLDKHFPNEHWKVWTRSVKDSWHKRLIIVCFYGFDPDAAELERKERRARYEMIKTTGDRNRELRAQADRMRAAQETESNRRARGLG